jgi:hypothetical protein
LPWHEVLTGSLKAEAGLCFDMNIVVNDFDAITDPLPQTRIGWNFGMGPSIDPGLLGSVVLSGERLVAGAKFPPPPARPVASSDPVPPPRFWIDYLRQLDQQPPVVVPVGRDPRETLGAARFAALALLEDHLQRFPRVDYFEMVARAQRRMQRELAGMMATGVPYLFTLVAERLRREIAVAATGRSIQRLAPAGWLVRSAEGVFAIDPQGPAAEVVAGGLEALCFTNSADLLRTSVPTVHRVWSLGKRVLAHISFHVPAVEPKDLLLTTPGDQVEIGKLKFEVLGVVAEDGKVTPTVGYRVEWPDGHVLVHAALSLLEESLGPQPRVDWLILPLRHPHARALVERLRPGLVLIDDHLEFHTAAPESFFGRKSLAEALAFQAQIAPTAPSVLLSWGESLALPERAR